MKKILLIAGARPNFMKIAPIARALQKASATLSFRIVHTGQHYDAGMSQTFFDELGIPQPDYNLSVGSASHSVQTANIMIKFEEVCLKEKPDVVVVVGDVNSTVACGLVAKKLNIGLAHVEAGLRSNDRSMPEEINRIVTDAIADHLFVTEKSGVENLLREGHPASRVHFVGHVMIDNLYYQMEQLNRTGACSSGPLASAGSPNSSQQKDVGTQTGHPADCNQRTRQTCFFAHANKSVSKERVQDKGTRPLTEGPTRQANRGLKLTVSRELKEKINGRYAVLTMHRPSNVDNKETLEKLVSRFKKLSEQVPIIFPCHPRTLARIKEHGLSAHLNEWKSGDFDIAQSPGKAAGIIVTAPLGYMDFLNLWKDAVCVLTDSGGLQEETTALKIPCITFRETTERPITVEVGSNEVVGIDTGKIEGFFNKAVEGKWKKSEVPELWDGKASERIVDWLV